MGAPSEHSLGVHHFILPLLFVTFCIICISLLLHGRNRQATSNKLAANIMMGHAILGLIHYLGKFHMYALHRSMSETFCWLYGHLEITYILFVPYSLLVFTTDRLIFIKDPESYAKKISTCVLIAMLVIAWVFAIVVAANIEIAYLVPAIIDVFHSETPNPERQDNAEHKTINVCIVYGESELFRRVVMQALYFIQELYALKCTVVILAMWYRYKKKHVRYMDFSKMGEEITSTVKSSAITVTVVNGCFFALYLWLSFFTHVLGIVIPLALFGVIEGLVFVCNPKNTHRILSLCCSCCKCNLESGNPIYSEGQESEGTGRL